MCHRAGLSFTKLKKIWHRAARAGVIAGLLTLAAAALWLLLVARRPPPALAVAKRTTPPAPLDDPIKHTKPLKPFAAVLTRSLYVAGHSRPHPELCPALGAHTRLLILVSSAPAHNPAREAVRLTWGHAALRADVALAFVLGVPPPALRAVLDAEDALYGDLIEGRFVDSYGNLTLKTISMLEWVNRYCPRAPRLLKTDDDVFINVPKLLKFAEDPVRRNATNTVWGKVLNGSWPLRSLRQKYYLPPEQFDGAVLPNFATGPAYLVTADAARRLLQAAPSERYLRLEDVFVTGVLAERLGVRRVHVPEFYNKRLTPQRLHKCAVQHLLTIHTVPYYEQLDLWQKLFNRSTKCPPNVTDYVHGTSAGRTDLRVIIYPTLSVCLLRLHVLIARPTSI